MGVQTAWLLLGGGSPGLLSSIISTHVAVTTANFLVKCRPGVAENQAIDAGNGGPTS